MNIEVGSISSYFAIFVSFLALLFTRKSWLESNRPIITAEIVTHGHGNTATAYTLQIHNIGNRPACEVQLNASTTDIKKILSGTGNENLTKEIYKCFSDDAVIAVLNHGKSVSNGFGSTSIEAEDNILIYKSKLPIIITYKDLNSRKYKSSLNLIVKNSIFFAGSGWIDKSEEKNLTKN